MKSERISEDFYSNCLIEAIRAKLKDPKNIKIYICSPIYNEAPCPHVMWSDGIADYDFGTSDYLPIILAWTIHKGYIRKRNLGFAQHYIETRRRVRIRARRYRRRYRKTWRCQNGLHLRFLGHEGICSNLYGWIRTLQRSKLRNVSTISEENKGG